MHCWRGQVIDKPATGAATFHSNPPGPAHPARIERVSCTQEAISDAVDKYRSVNAITYGRLGYILLVTMAGSRMAVYGMPLLANLQTHNLVTLI